jgi:hypothetical protein
VADALVGALVEAEAAGSAVGDVETSRVSWKYSWPEATRGEFGRARYTGRQGIFWDEYFATAGLLTAGRHVALSPPVRTFSSRGFST